MKQKGIQPIKKGALIVALVSFGLHADDDVIYTRTDNSKFDSEIQCADAQGTITTVKIPGAICGVVDNKRKACSVIDDNGNRVQLKPVRCITVDK